MSRQAHIFGSLAVALLVVACDAQLSGFDRVSVDASATATDVSDAAVDGTTATRAGGGGRDVGDDGGGAGDAEAEGGEDAAHGGEDAAAGATGTGTDTTSGPDSETGSETVSGTGTDTGGSETATGTGTDTGSSGTDTGTSTTDGTAPTVNAGADLAANAAFTRTATVTDESATTVLWSKVSGPGTVSFGAATAETTTISASADGTYVIRITAQDAGGLQASDDFTLIWDTTGPTNSAWGLRIAKSAGGAHASVLNENDDLEVFLEWDTAVDASSVRDYTLTHYTDGDCGVSGGASTQLAGLTAPSQALTLVNGAVRSFTVRAYDDFGQASAESPCSSSIVVDTTDPVDITGLQAAAGGNVGTVLVTVDFDTTPAVIAGYDTVRIVRGAAGGAAATCASSTVVKTYTAGQFADGSFTDFTNAAGAAFQYRACVYDAAGNLADGQFGSGTSKSHILFVGLPGSTGIQGDFGLAPPGSVGVARGDEVCQAEAAGSALADVASETASNWRAVLSDATTDAKWRTLILGVVKNPLLTETYANGRSTMWGVSLVGANALPSPHTPDDDAYSGTSFWSVWTGSDADGMRTGSHCNNWSDSTAGNGTLGNPSVATTDWIGTGATLSCSDASGAGVYCINQPAAPNPIGVTPGATTASSVSLSIDVPDDSVSLSRYARITIRRLAAGSYPDGNCATAGDVVLTSGFGTGFPGFPVVATPQQVVDASGISGSTTYRYRVCGYDVHGNLISSTTALATTP